METSSSSAIFKVPPEISIDPLVKEISPDVLLPTVNVPPSKSKVPPSTTAEVLELLLIFKTPEVIWNVPAVTTKSSSMLTVSPSIKNVLEPEVKSIDLQLISPVVVTEPPVEVVFMVMSLSLNAQILCDPLLSMVILAALPEIKFPDVLFIFSLR